MKELTFKLGQVFCLNESFLICADRDPLSMKEHFYESAAKSK